MEHSSPKQKLVHWCHRAFGLNFNKVFEEDYRSEDGLYICTLKFLDPTLLSGEKLGIKELEEGLIIGERSKGKKMTRVDASTRAWNLVKQKAAVDIPVATAGSNAQEISSLGSYKVLLSQFSQRSNRIFCQRFELTTKCLDGQFQSTIIDKDDPNLKFTGKKFKSRKIAEFDACKAMWENGISVKLTAPNPESTKSALKVEALMGDKILDTALVRYQHRLHRLSIKGKKDAVLLTASQLTYLTTKYTTNEYLRSKMHNFGLNPTAFPIIDASRVEQWIWREFTKLNENFDALTRVLVEKLEIGDGIYNEAVEDIGLNTYYDEGTARVDACTRPIFR